MGRLAVARGRARPVTMGVAIVVELVAEGRSNQGIAARLVVSERAVEKQVTSIFGQLGLPPAPTDHRRVLAVLKYLGRN